jgi:hypothetical protein
MCVDIARPNNEARVCIFFFFCFSYNWQAFIRQIGIALKTVLFWIASIFQVCAFPPTADAAATVDVVLLKLVLGIPFCTFLLFVSYRT